MHRILVPISFLLIWGTSSYMSVTGLVAAIHGAGLIIVLMGCGLELGKITIVIFLHRRWCAMGILSRGFYVVVAFCLTIMTSIEVMGFLSQRHAEAVREIKLIDIRMGALDREEAILKNEIKTIDNTLSGLPTGYVTKRIVERRDIGYGGMQKRLVEITRERAALDAGNIRAIAYTGPIFSAARIMGFSNERAIRVFILALVIIFEPLSIGLAVATSAVMGQYGQLAKKNRNGKYFYGAGRIDQPKRSKITETANMPILGDNGRSILTKELQEIMAHYGLEPDNVADITGKRKLQTIEGWVIGQPEIPIKAMRALRKWVINKKSHEQLNGS